MVKLYQVHPFPIATNMAIRTEIQFACKRIKLPKNQIQQAVEQIASDYGWTDGEISIAIVNDPQIHQLNLDYLNHDYPTDVISFDTTESNQFLEGEVIVSADTALNVASKNGWQPSHELLLYIIHGMLHIVGLDDSTRSKAKQMRDEEHYYIKALLGDVSVCCKAR
jgi:probable rRNA maturation factor